MTLDLSRIESLFDMLQAGNRDVLVEIIEAERQRIFDYLLRMTGQRDASVDVLDEVTKALSSHPQQYSDLQAFRVSLYATVRSFSANFWNADTNQLMNDGFGSYQASEEHLAQLKNIDRALCSLPGWEREPILLQMRCGFSGGDIAKVMGIDEQSSSYSFKSGIAKVARSTALDFDSVEELISKIPNHPLGVNSQESTMALSQIMDDIGKVRRGIRPSWRLKAVLAAVAIATAVYFLFFYK